MANFWIYEQLTAMFSHHVIAVFFLVLFLLAVIATWGFVSLIHWLESGMRRAEIRRKHSKEKRAKRKSFPRDEEIQTIVREQFDACVSQTASSYLCERNESTFVDHPNDPWFTSVARASNASGSPVFEGYASSSLDQITNARSIFMDDARQLITLTLVLFVAAGLLASFGVSERVTGVMESSLLIFSAILVVYFVFPITRVVQSKAIAAYHLYVAAAIHATVLHQALGFGETHEWFRHVVRNMEQVTKEDLDEACANEYSDGFEANEFVKVHWKRLIIIRWTKTSGLLANDRTMKDRFQTWYTFIKATDPKPSAFRSGGNILFSFFKLVQSAQIAALVAMIAGLLFFGFHLLENLPWATIGKTLSNLVQ